MRYRNRVLSLSLLLLGLVLSVPCWSPEFASGSVASISGQVVDGKGPVTGAFVRVQGSPLVVETDSGGRFSLTGLPAGKPVHLSVWKEGYYSALSGETAAPRNDMRLKLIRYVITDNMKYEWLSPRGKNGCSECHPALTEMSLNDPHLKSTRNPRFLTMYYGTDRDGNKSPPTRYGVGGGIWQNSKVPRTPDPAKPYYGPGYLLDFPGTKGDCTACHIPGASIPYNVDPVKAKGADLHGVHCDFCHKVNDVKVHSQSGLPNRHRPGVHSMEIRRPFGNDTERSQFFFGTFEDVNAPANDAYLPLLKESRFCASCHFGVFWDTVVYNSYGEWLKSPYADPKSGKAKTCQECHMPSPTLYKGKPLTNIALGKGGIERDPAAIHNHNMTVDAELLKNSLTMTASAKIEDGRVVVNVGLLNDKTGHHVPSDSPLRHVILIVDAKDPGGKPLERMEGPVLPEWCGQGNRAKGHYAGLPGKAYAKLLKEKWTEVSPTGAYWNHTELVSDNRLAAFATDRSTWSFSAPQSGKAVVTVKLLYRRAFIQLMEQKKWDVPDIIMA
ncbi:MAG: carboxypeptidase regulatory-like domain-containing protein, partial [Deltaproteobacteria bacterium]|nr:carboxypeptidase regulatory-like domain-containing protein [Deltaproteobacteria bacterium]